jgi:hypothetical protein
MNHLWDVNFLHVVASEPPLQTLHRYDVAIATGTNATLEVSSIVKSGTAAPTAKVPAEANAAWTGLAVVIHEMPISSRACAASAS